MSEHYVMSLDLLTYIVNTIIPKLFFRFEVDNEVITLYIPRGYKQKIRNLLSGAFLRISVLLPSNDYHIRYLDILIVEE